MWKIYGPPRVLSHTFHYLFYVFYCIKAKSGMKKTRGEAWKVKNSLKLIDIHVGSLNITDFMGASERLSFVYIFQACANHPLLLSIMFSHLMLFAQTIPNGIHLSQCLSQEHNALPEWTLCFIQVLRSKTISSVLLMSFSFFLFCFNFPQVHHYLIDLKQKQILAKSASLYVEVSRIV